MRAKKKKAIRKGGQMGSLPFSSSARPAGFINLHTVRLMLKRKRSKFQLQRRHRRHCRRLIDVHNGLLFSGCSLTFFFSIFVRRRDEEHFFPLFVVQRLRGKYLQKLKRPMKIFNFTTIWLKKNDENAMGRSASIKKFRCFERRPADCVMVTKADIDY